MKRGPGYYSDDNDFYNPLRENSEILYKLPVASAVKGEPEKSFSPEKFVPEEYYERSFDNREVINGDYADDFEEADVNGGVAESIEKISGQTEERSQKDLELNDDTLGSSEDTQEDEQTKVEEKVEGREVNTDVFSSENSNEIPEAKGTEEEQEQLERKTKVSSHENFKETTETRNSIEDLNTGNDSTQREDEKENRFDGDKDSSNEPAVNEIDRMRKKTNLMVIRIPVMS